MDYEFVGALESDDSDGVSSDKDEEDSHDVEVNRSPVVFEYHIRIPGHEYDQVDLLSFVGDADDVLGSEDFKEEDEDCEEMEKVSNKLKDVHCFIAL